MNVDEFIEEICAVAKDYCDSFYLVLLGVVPDEVIYHHMSSISMYAEYGAEYGESECVIFIAHEYQLTQPKRGEERSTTRCDNSKVDRLKWIFQL